MRSRALVALTVALACAVAAIAQEPSRLTLADRARDKIEAIKAAAETPRPARARPISTALTEAEINAYFGVHGREVLPSGIADPVVRLRDDGRVRARAIVDLDAVRRARPRDWRDPLFYVTGAVEVVASGTVTAESGIGRARLESATVAGVTVPSAVIREVLRFYTRSPERPDGLDLDAPFELPANIRSAAIEHERVTIVQ